jgi:predicted dehydrogenase
MPEAGGSAGRTLGWGIVGTGGIAAAVSADIARLPGASIVAVSSRTTTRAEEFARSLGADRGYDSVDALVADPRVDVVYVATPHAQHHDATRRALLVGKAVLCEKALTVTVADAEDLVALADSRRVFLMEAMWMRFNPLVQKARDLSADGAIGEIRSVSANLGFAPTYDPAHRLFDPAAGGGALLDIGVYPVSLVHYLLGTPDSFVAHGSLAPNGVDFEESLLLRYSGGISGQVFSTLRATPAGDATIVGSAGRIMLEGPIYAPPRLTIVRGDGEPEIHTATADGSSYLPQLREVQESVLAGRTESTTMPWSDSLAVLRILAGVLDQLGVHYPAADID